MNIFIGLSHSKSPKIWLHGALGRQVCLAKLSLLSRLPNSLHRAILPPCLCRDYTADPLSSRFNLQHFIFQEWHYREIRLTYQAILKGAYNPMEFPIEWENWSCVLISWLGFLLPISKYLLSSKQCSEHSIGQREVEKQRRQWNACLSVVNCPGYYFPLCNHLST